MITVTTKARKAFKELTEKQGMESPIFRIITAGYG